MKKLSILLALLSLVSTGEMARAGIILFGVTGDGGSPPETLFTINTADATPTFFQALGNGEDGESIAFNPDDGLLYHLSGGYFDTLVFETIDLTTNSVNTVATFNAGGSVDMEIQSFTYAGGGNFLFADRGEVFWNLTTDGVASVIGSIDTATKGLALVGSTLYSVQSDDNLLRTIDPLTGGTLGSVEMTISGGSIQWANGLATDPSTGELYVMLTTNNLGGNRRLGIVDPLTGVVTDIGGTGEKFAGIAFAETPIPEPATMLLLASGIIGLLGFRRRLAKG